MSLVVILSTSFLLSVLENIVFIGFLFPSIIILAGLVQTVPLSALSWFIACITFGSFIGSVISYKIGYWWGKKVIKFKQISKKVIKHTVFSILIAKFFGPLRGVIPCVAGAYKFNWKMFIILDAIASITWAIVYTLVTRGIVDFFELDIVSLIVIFACGLFVLIKLQNYIIINIGYQVQN